MIRAEKNEQTLTIYLEGRIDSANAPAVEIEVNNIINGAAPENLILDAEKLEYISSSGLRVILKLRKQFSDITITNTSGEVYEIFDMTGFTELVTVEKALRHLDVSGCEVVGRGAHGVVYRMNRDTIIKVYDDATSLDDIKRERELARTAFLLGVPTAIPFDVVQVGGSFGSVFELLNAKSFAELLQQDAGKLEYVAEESAKLARLMHDTMAPRGLFRQRDEALIWVSMVKDYFAPEQYEKLRSLVLAVPENGCLLHGDLHIKNIMLQNGEALLIDMDTLGTGHPVFELAFMFNAYKGFGVADKTEVENFLGISAELAYSLWRRILALYLETDDKEKLDMVEAKASLVGYLRVMRRVIRLKQQDTPKGEAVVSACKKAIEERLSMVDTLDF